MSQNLPEIASLHTEAATRCREKISRAMQGATVAFYDMAMGLLEAYENEYAKEWGFANFSEYVEKELDMKFRSAYYMVEIGKTVRQLGIDADRVQKIGWSKMKEITGAMSAAPEDSEKYLHMAETMSSRELKEAMRSEVSVQEAKEGKAAIMRMSLKFEGDTAAMISDALSAAYGDIGKEDVSLGLAHIAGEWLMARSGEAKASTLEQWQSFIEKTFGVKLVKSEEADNLDSLLAEPFSDDTAETIDAELEEDDALDELLK